MSFGLAPCGITPAGVSVPDAAPATVTETHCRALDPVAHGWTQLADGSYTQTTPTRQRLTLIIATELGSAAAPDHGIERPRKVGRSWQRAMRARIQIAVQSLVQDGSIELLEVTTSDLGGGRVSVRIDYHDLVSGERDQTLTTDG